jgi:tetratricopeptide (TPR) repeat protein
MSLSFATTRRMLSAASLVTLALAPSRLMGQSAADHVALGDKDHAAANAPSALRHYEEALKLDPRSYDALVKATREAVDVGEFNADEKERERLYTAAEQYARRAVEVNPADDEGHFQLARALGRKALTLGSKERVKYAGDVRAAALEALRISNQKHPGALHVMGMWNYNIMKLSGFTRMMAKTFLGGKIFNEANWEAAQRYMEASVAVEPNRLVHHLDLARVYAARDNKAKAREHYDVVIKGTASEFNDRRYQDEARREIEEVR